MSRKETSKFIKGLEEYRCKPETWEGQNRVSREVQRAGGHIAETLERMLSIGLQQVSENVRAGAVDFIVAIQNGDGQRAKQALDYVLPGVERRRAYELVAVLITLYEIGKAHGVLTGEGEPKETGPHPVQTANLAQVIGNFGS